MQSHDADGRLRVRLPRFPERRVPKRPMTGSLWPQEE
jgi:hypothetical protein